MSTEPSTGAKRSNAYELFVLVLTVLSLGIMVVLVLPVSDATEQLLITYDNAICVVFLIDFFGNLFRAPTKREYFIGRRGWLDRSVRSRASGSSSTQRCSAWLGCLASRGSLAYCVGRRSAS
jgi:hypothetical protein